MQRDDSILDRFFDDLPYLEQSPWKPATDILRTRESWIVKLDLAGVAPEDLSVTIEGKTLHVAGRRRDIHAAESIDHYRMEITYSSFERRFEIPCDLGTCNMATQYRDGILLILLQAKG